MARQAEVHPVIVSASRSTDIPAFYARWFVNRLRAGYALWQNPFNRAVTRVCLDKTRVVVFWTKNPAPLIPYLKEMDERGIHYYFQYTLNDYERERLEPNVPPIEERIETFRRLSDMIGPERVIWRYDPIVLCGQMTARDLLTRVYHVGNKLCHATEKLVFSFIDVGGYRKVQNNLVRDTGLWTAENVGRAELTQEQAKEIAEGLAKLRDHWRTEEGWELQLATCAEKIDLESLGIGHNRCVDGELMERLWAEDRQLVYFLRTGKVAEPDLFGAVPPIPERGKNIKDKGQRMACGCIMSKDIGMYNTCRHFCAYCYANTSRRVVESNAGKTSDESESLMPL